MTRSTPAFSLLGILTLALPLAAQDAKSGKEAEPSERLVVTSHRITLGDQELRYTATAGYQLLKSYEGKPKAKLFFMAYLKDGVEDPATRPVTFAFNGGPGSSSVWLHLGALGPRRVKFGPEGEALPPPHRLVDNAWSWLGFTDLVFIDPVSTGFSRTVKGESPKQFHGLDEDLKSVGQFIRTWVTRYKRWGSPKYLAGESYGTTRAAGLARRLQDQFGMYLNGVVLVSPVLNFQTIRFHPGNDLPYWLFLPTYTATAWHHKKLPPDLQRLALGTVLREVEQWAGTDYLLALARGNRLTPAKREEVVKRLVRYTGLSAAYVRGSNLRIRIYSFTKELLRGSRRTVGRLDSRYKGIDRRTTGGNAGYDPSYAAILGPFSAALNDYLRSELRFESDETYEILTRRVRPWNYGSARNRYVNVGEDLRQAMAKNRDLRVLFACGYFDLATPYFAADYTVAHLGLDRRQLENVSTTYYEAGHMMYLRMEDLKKLTADVSRFYRAGERTRNR